MQKAKATKSVGSYCLLILLLSIANAFASLFIGSVLFSIIVFSVKGLASLVIFRLFLPFYLIVETLGAVYLIHKYLLPLQPPSIRKWQGLSFILSTLIAAQAIALFAPTHIGRALDQYKNPIRTGKQTYDFSRSVLVHERKSAKELIYAEDNKILWSEDVYRDGSAWDRDLFLFVVNLSDSTGEIHRITHLGPPDWTASLELKNNSRLYEGEVYYKVGDSFYSYDPETKKTQTISRESFDAIPFRKLDEYSFTHPMNEGYVVKFETPYYATQDDSCRYCKIIKFEKSY